MARISDFFLICAPCYSKVSPVFAVDCPSRLTFDIQPPGGLSIDWIAHTTFVVCMPCQHNPDATATSAAEPSHAMYNAILFE